MTASTAAQPAPVARPGKALNRTLWTLQIVLGLFFIIASGLPKLVGQHDAVQSFRGIRVGRDPCGNNTEYDSREQRKDESKA